MQMRKKAVRNDNVAREVRRLLKSRERGATVSQEEVRKLADQVIKRRRKS